MTERMTPAQWQAAHAKPASKSKFSAEQVVQGGIRFDSKREAKRHAQLVMLERGGLIRDLQRQVSIRLMGRDGPLRAIGGRALTYRADFTYIEVATGKLVVEDAKGFATPEYKLKRAILAAQGVQIVEV